MNEIMYVDTLVEARKRYKKRKTVFFWLFAIFLILAFSSIGVAIYFVGKWYDEVYPAKLPLMDFSSLNYLIAFCSVFGVVLFLILAVLFLAFGVFYTTRYEEVNSNIQKAFAQDKDGTLMQKFGSRNLKKILKEEAKTKNQEDQTSPFLNPSKTLTYSSSENSETNNETNNKKGISKKPKEEETIIINNSKPKKIKTIYVKAKNSKSKNTDIPFIDVENELFNENKKTKKRRRRKSSK